MRSTAFLVRSIRQDSRLVTHHAMRAAMAVVILYLFFIQMNFARLRVGAGGIFAREVVFCCYWFLTLVGGMHFCTAIVEEKEEQTLPLLRMTGASAFSILAGKSLPRLMVAVLFLVSVAPFLILSISLGGVLPLGLIGAILSIVCYAIMLSQIGLLASVVSKSASVAFSVTCFLWAGVELSHWWLGMLGAAMDDGGTLYQFQSQFVLVGNLSSTLLAFDPSELWFPHMTFHLIVAAIAFAVSWLLFEQFTDVVAGERPARPALSSSRVGGRVWDNALAWKSWRHLAGGWRGIWIRAVAVPLCCFTATVLLLAVFDGDAELPIVAGITLAMGVATMLVNLARLCGAVFHSEIHQKTLPALVMLPQPLSHTMASTIAGLVPSMAAGSVTAVLSLTVLFLVGIFTNEPVGNAIQFLVQPWFLHFFSWVAVTLHLGVLLSTHVRHGGMLMAIGILWLGAPLCCGTALGVLAGSGGGGFDLMAYGLPVLLIIAEVIACLFLQQMTLGRLEELAGQ